MFAVASLSQRLAVMIVPTAHVIVLIVLQPMYSLHDKVATAKS